MLMGVSHFICCSLPTPWYRKHFTVEEDGSLGSFWTFIMYIKFRSVMYISKLHIICTNVLMISVSHCHTRIALDLGNSNLLCTSCLQLKPKHVANWTYLWVSQSHLQCVFSYTLESWLIMDEDNAFKYINYTIQRYLKILMSLTNNS